MDCQCNHCDCKRRRLEGHDRCILHAEVEKDLDAFHRAFDQHRRESSNFDHVVFPPNSAPFFNPVSYDSISFSDATFKTTVHFQNTVFQRGVDFAGVLFEEQVFFRGAHFLGNCDFSGAKFKKGVDFRECCFDSICTFKGASFDTGREIEGADFSRSTFGSSADFSDTVFKVGLFGGAVFHEDTSFKNSHFLEYVCFSAEFLGPSTFENARFEGSLDLRGARLNHAPNSDDFLLHEGVLREK
jgi:uncharacterized protein YjbI with pentapeptide repeats